jgi:endonuclease YncB( thermonuclease family)
MKVKSHGRLRLLSALLGSLALLVAATLRWGGRTPEIPASAIKTAPLPANQVTGEQRRCVRVVDGDTIELDGGERVRLIGVNTPESVDPRRPVEYFGKEAAEFTRRMVEGGKVRLEFDDQTRDDYGRTLAYVHLSDGTLLNAELIRQGYGFAYTRFPYRRQQEFVALEREAREQGRGLWAR